MAFCSNCGTQVPDGVKFCPNCGTAAEAAEGQAYQAPQAGQPVYEQQGYQQAQGGGELNKTMAILAVVFPVLFFLPLVAGDKTEFDKFWANQALLLFLLGIVSSLLAAIIIGLLLYVVMVVFWILAIISVCKGEMKPLPLIGSIIIIK